ncbi:MAG: MFS transporter [Thermomicrobiales bacterium]
MIEIWHLFVIGLLQGIAFPFTMPTRTAFMSVLVGKEHMANALALDSTGRNLNMIAAPALAGILIAWNPTIAFYIVALFYALAVMTLLRLPSGSRGSATSGGTVQQMLYGFRYILGSRVLSMFILLSIVPILIGMPFQQLLPVFQKDVLDVGPEALGLMFAMVGIGALLGSLGAAYFANSPNIGRAQIVCGLGFGVALTGFALSPVFVLSLALLLVVGLTSQTYMTINRSLLMLNTDPSLYGRVMSVYVMQWYLMPVALLPLGLLADGIGASPTVAMTGLAITVFMIAVFARSPETFRATTPSPVAAAGD